MRIDSSGNVGIGTTSPDVRLNVVRGSTGTVASFGIEGLTINPKLRIDADESNNTVTLNPNYSGATSPALVFKTQEIERMRITPSGYVKASYDGTYVAVASSFHEFIGNAANNTILQCTHESATEPYGTTVDFSAASPNNGTNYFLRCSDTTNTKLNIFSNGTVTNRTGTYNSFSDLKLKQDIVDASSQWEDIKSLRVVNYRLKQEVAIDPNYPSFIGVIAQEVEKISPALVENNPDLGEIEITDEKGNITKQITKTGTVTKAVKYSILYMKAVKALQEAMERIEQLETKNTSLEATSTSQQTKINSLEARLTALES